MKTPQTTAPGYFVTGFIIGTAHSPDLIPLDCWFWSTMDRLIHLQKTNSILALNKLIYEAAGEISKNAVWRAVANFNRRVHLWIRNNGAHFEAEMWSGIFNLIKCKSPLFLSIFFLSTDFIGWYYWFLHIFRTSDRYIWSMEPILNPRLEITRNTLRLCIHSLKSRDISLASRRCLIMYTAWAITLLQYVLTLRNHNTNIYWGCLSLCTISHTWGQCWV